MAATIKDIARKAGVSHSTVSRALREKSLVSHETTERIKAVAREMGYQPSAAARSLKTNRTQVLGVVVSSIADPFFSEILDGIEANAQKFGYSLFIAASQHDTAKERKIVQTMMEQRIDGVIVCSSSFSAEQGRQLLAYGFPVVVVNYQAAENFNYSIYHDDIDGSYQVTRYLISLGHQRIAYLGNSLSGRTTLDRLAGYQQALAECGIQPPDDYVHHVPGADPALGAESAHYFNNLTPKPSAIVCYNDTLAIGVIRGCKEAGIDVPGEISITGFDNITYSAYTCPAITTFDQPKYSIGAEAAQLLLELLQDTDKQPDDAPKVKILKGKLLIRESTGPVSL